MVIIIIIRCTLQITIIIIIIIIIIIMIMIIIIIIIIIIITERQLNPKEPIQGVGFGTLQLLTESINFIIPFPPEVRHMSFLERKPICGFVYGVSSVTTG